MVFWQSLALAQTSKMDKVEIADFITQTSAEPDEHPVLTRRPATVPPNRTPTAAPVANQQPELSTTASNQTSAEASTNKEPKLLWTVVLPPPRPRNSTLAGNISFPTTSLGLGNIVTMPPSNMNFTNEIASSVYVNTREGRVLRLNITDGSVQSTYEFSRIFPDSLVERYCDSGLAFGYQAVVDSADSETKSQPIVVYAVKTKSVFSDGDFEGAASYIVALGLPNLEELWITRLEGSVAGTPIFAHPGSRPNDRFPQHSWVVITVNRLHKEPTHRGPIHEFGSLFLLDTRDGMVARRVDSSRDNGHVHDPESALYGPPTVLSASLHEQHRWMNIPSAAEDAVVIWSTSRHGRQYSRAFLHAFVIPQEFSALVDDVFDRNWRSNSSIVTLASFDGNGATRTPPVESAEAIFLGGDYNSLVTWDAANFSAQGWQLLVVPLNRSDLNESTRPIESISPLSQDKQRLFIGETGGALTCLDVVNDSVLWSRPLAAEIVAPTLPTDDNKRVIYVEATGARVVACEQATGRVLWEGTCEAFSEQTCSNAILASYTLSNDDQQLFFGDTGGRVVAMQIGIDNDTAPPVSSPSPLTGTLGPALPTLGPTRPTMSSPSPTEGTLKPDRQNSKKDSSAGFSLGFVVAVTSLIGLAVLVWLAYSIGICCDNRNRVKLEKQLRGSSTATQDRGGCGETNPEAGGTSVDYSFIDDDLIRTMDLDLSGMESAAMIEPDTDSGPVVNLRVFPVNDIYLSEQEHLRNDGVLAAATRVISDGNMKFGEEEALVARSSDEDQTRRVFDKLRNETVGWGSRSNQNLETLFFE
jgi:outer membrane protein assembly factor BamB